jgi:xanthine dehydrogenase accessory factor
MSFDLHAIEKAIPAHGEVVRVVVAETKGSVPREPGAAMLVWADGQSGTIGGGALEHQAVLAARAMLVAKSPDRVTRHPLGPALAQCCGGSVTLVSERYDLPRLREITDGASFARRVEGGSPMPLAIRRAQRQARGTGAACPVILADGWLIEPMIASARPLWIYGAGHVGRAIVAVLAPLPDFAITWIDTAPDRFPSDIPESVTILPASSPADLVRHAPVDAHHLVLTYSHALDLELCHAVLNHGFARAGLIGSATKWARFRSRLRQLGHAPAQIDRIECPIGDRRFGKHPQAIAIGVAADLLARAATVRTVSKDTTA